MIASQHALQLCLVQYRQRSKNGLYVKVIFSKFGSFVIINQVSGCHQKRRISVQEIHARHCSQLLLRALQRRVLRG